MGFGPKKASSAGGNFELVPAGAHAAVLVAIVQLGTQVEKYGEEESAAEKVYLCWEIPGEKTTKGTSHFICAFYTDSLNKKANLRLMLEGWRGKQFNDDESFEILSILGKSCLLQVAHGKSANDNPYAKVSSVGQLPKGSPAPVATQKPFSWAIEDDPEKLPDWLPFVIGKSVKEKVANSEEKKGRKAMPSTNGAAKAEVEVPEDACPF